MERDVGIVGYLTSTPGVGGTIKSAPEDFVVEEISSPPAVSPEGRYAIAQVRVRNRSEEHTSELQSRFDLVCRLLLEKKKKQKYSSRTVTFKKVATNAVTAI